MGWLIGDRRWAGDRWAGGAVTIAGCTLAIGGASGYEDGNAINTVNLPPAHGLPRGP